MKRTDLSSGAKGNVLAGLGLATAAGFVALSSAGDALGQGAGGDQGMTLSGVVRDFRERTAEGGHPDFERKPDAGFGHYMGNVAATLDAEGKPIFTGAGWKVSSQWTDASGVPIHPTYFDSSQGDSAGSFGTADSGGIQSETSFRQWFRDVPGVNSSKTLPMRLEYDAGRDIWFFDDREDPVFQSRGGFFPIDDDLFGNSDGEDRNFHFTFELDTQFEYEAGQGDYFKFRGDDDVWVFINGELVIDIGGVHSVVEQVVYLDRLGLSDGQIYDLKFFFAERHRTQSNFRIETSFPLRSGNLPATSALFD